MRFLKPVVMTSLVLSSLPPKEIVLDFDGTDIPVHGEQPGKFFNRYYDHHCYFPLYLSLIHI